MKEFICIVCPRGCHIKVDGENITGYTCKRGLEYVKQESVAPKRTVTSTVKVKNGDLRVVSCRTTEPIDKNKMFDLMNIINKIEVEAPVKEEALVTKKPAVKKSTNKKPATKKSSSLKTK